LISNIRSRAGQISLEWPPEPFADSLVASMSLA
jgi:hypothetical protein